MTRLIDIITVSLGAAALVTLVYAKDRPTPTPGVRTAIELIGNKEASLTSQRMAPRLGWCSNLGELLLTNAG